MAIDHTPDRPELYGFRLDHICGHGGTGTVYRGRDPKKGEVYAIKLFRENFFRHALHLRDLKKARSKRPKKDDPE